MLTVNTNTCTQTLSGQWIGVYDYIRKGDLVHVGPVHQKRMGIALERKTVSFGFEPDEWLVLVDGKVLIYSAYYISTANTIKIQRQVNDYNHLSYDGGKNG